MKFDKAILGYVLFYLSVVFFFGLYSVILDEIFFKIDYGKGYGVLSSFFYYVTYLIVGTLPISVPVIVLYNWIALNAFENLQHKNFLRIIFAFFIGLMIGFMVKRNIDSFYIGNLRPLKNIILFPLIGISSELFRIFVMKRKKIQSRHEQNL